MKASATPFGAAKDELANEAPNGVPAHRDPAAPNGGGDVPESAAPEAVSATDQGNGRATESPQASPRTALGGSSSAPPATSGLYGGASVPGIRGGDAGRPRAAAIQLNASGTGGRVLMGEEEEPIEVGEAEGSFDGEISDGFSVALHEDEAFEEEAEPEAPLAATAEVVVEPPGPSAEELASIMSQAQSVAATGNLQGAADLYSDVIDAEPAHAYAHVARGRLYLDLGDYSPRHERLHGGRGHCSGGPRAPSGDWRSCTSRERTTGAPSTTSTRRSKCPQITRWATAGAASATTTGRTTETPSTTCFGPRSSNLTSPTSPPTSPWLARRPPDAVDRRWVRSHLRTAQPQMRTRPRTGRTNYVPTRTIAALSLAGLLQ